MTTGPDRQRRTPSTPRGKTMQQRLEEARVRRAEVLAAKEPANSDARQSKRVTKSKNAPQPVASPEPETRTPSQERFPAIVMPSDTPDAANDAKPKKRKGWLPFMVIALLAIIFGTFYALPTAKAPFTTQAITTPIAPEQTSAINRPALETPAVRAETVVALAPPTVTLDPTFPTRLLNVIAGIENATAVTASLEDSADIIAPILPKGQAPLSSIRPLPRSTGIDLIQMSEDIEAVVRTATQ